MRRGDNNAGNVPEDGNIVEDDGAVVAARHRGGRQPLVAVAKDEAVTKAMGVDPGSDVVLVVIRMLLAQPKCEHQ